MKKMYLMFILLSMTVMSYSQGNGNEDCRTKVTSTDSTITIKNKGVSTKYRIEQTNQPDIVTDSVLEGNSITLPIRRGCTVIRITALSASMSCKANFVDLKNLCYVMPVIFSSLNAQYDKIRNEVTIDFVLQQATDMKSIEFDVRTDNGIRKAKTILPSDVKINTNTRLTIKLN